MPGIPLSGPSGRAASTATTSAVKIVIRTGVPRDDSLARLAGSNPSRAMVKKMRLCPYIITTITEGTMPAMHYLRSGELGTLGPLMAPDLLVANQGVLIQRVLAGDDSLIPGFFRPALGGGSNTSKSLAPANPGKARISAM